MPMQQGKSSLSAKYGAKVDAAAKKHAADPVDRGFQSLPPGIKNGVAQLTVCGFFTYDANTKARKADGQSAVGELYFRAAAVVVAPTHVNVEGQGAVQVKGQQTSIMEPVCETKNSKGAVVSVDNHVQEIQNHLKLLGASAESISSGEGMEATAAALQEQKPYVQFSTSQGKATKEYPEPRTFENWHGLAEGFVPEGGDPATSGVSEEPQPSAGGDGAQPPADTTTGAGGDADADGALTELAAKADAKPPDSDACAELEKIALAAGVAQDAITGANDWVEVVAMIQQAKSSGAAPEAGTAAPTEKDWEPKISEPYKYVLKDKDGKPVKSPKTKRPVKHDVEVTSVSAKNKTVNLKDLDDGKSVYKGVSWDELEEHS